MSGKSELAAAVRAMAVVLEGEAQALRVLADELTRPDAPSPSEEFVDAATVRHLGVSPRRFREAIAEGDLVGYRVGKRLLARRADVVAFVERHPVTANPRARVSESTNESVDAKIQNLLDAGRLRVIPAR